MNMLDAESNKNNEMADHFIFQDLKRYFNIYAIPLSSAVS